MKESYKGDLANHFGLELYADGGSVMGVTTAVVSAGKLLSSVPHPYRVPTLSVLREGKTFQCDIGERWNGSAESKPYPQGASWIWLGEFIGAALRRSDVHCS